MNQISEYNETTFESIKHINEHGNEYWCARELQVALEYKEWRKFFRVIEKAKEACNNSKFKVSDHFAQADKMVEIGSDAKRKNLRYREDILDNMGSEELAANLFRITQTEAKLKRDNISSEETANQTHYNIGKNIREVIIKNGGTMPEKLPTPK